jgi:transcriptional regulator with XRE-family HTH domain
MDYSIIKKLLDERNISFKELSDKLGVDRNNLYNSLTKGNPTLQRLESVAEVLGVPVRRLFTEDTKPELFGTIIYDGEVYSVSSKEELRSITAKIVGANS